MYFVLNKSMNKCIIQPNKTNKSTNRHDPILIFLLL